MRRVSLRPLKILDLFDIYVNIRDERVTKWTIPPKTKLADRRVIFYFCTVFRHTLKGLALIFRPFLPLQRRRTIQLAILLKSTGRAIGIVTLERPNLLDEEVRVSFWIGVAYWGQGIMSEVLPMAIDFAFEKLGIRGITAWTYEANVGSRKVLEKCGFKFVGKDENAYFKFGQWHNRLNYNIIKKDWLKFKKDYLNKEADRVQKGV